MTISTLELNTFAHAVCTLLIYFLWWDKPLDIEEPTIIRGEAAHPVIALLVVQAGFHTKAHRISKRHPSHGEFSEMSYVQENVDPVKVRFRIISQQADLAFKQSSIEPAPTPLRQPREIYDADLPLLPGFTRGYLGQKIAHGFYVARIYSTEGFWQRVRKPLGRDRGTSYLAVDLSPELVHCLKLAEYAYNKLAGRVHVYFLTFGDPYSINRIRNTTFIGRLSRDTWSVIAGATIAGILYGGLHLTAWNAPLGVNSLYWRIASVIVAVSGPSVAPLLLFERYATLSFDRRPWALIFDSRRRVVFNFFLASTFLLLIVITITCIVARVCLSVLCFIELRSLPASTYEVPQWSQIFPHIS